MWFEELTGFFEDSGTIYSMLEYHQGTLFSKANQRSFVSGELTTPNLAQLRRLAAEREDTLAGPLQLSELVADVQSLHKDPANAGAFFQVASQFNLLEMVSPEVSPEHGISGYQYDRTQGPACAIACGAGTIYRNYFVEVAGKAGQSRNRQLDMLADVSLALGNADHSLFQMKNGYALPSTKGLQTINGKLNSASDQELAALRDQLRIGIHANTQVTLQDCTHLVTQAYCSALPVAYTSHAADSWAAFARFVLDAAYEATLAAAVLNAANTGNKTVFLTLLGGGAFGNKTEWIMAAIARALALYQHVALDVKLVSYGSSNQAVRQLVEEFQQNRK